MDIEPAYQNTLDYLYSFVDYRLTRGFRNQPGLFDLDRMLEFMAYLGNPYQAYPILHVAGTKGKGSVCYMLEAALRGCKLATGMFVSPHVLDERERIQRDWKFTRLSKIVSEQPPPTFGTMCKNTWRGSNTRSRILNARFKT